MWIAQLNHLMDRKEASETRKTEVFMQQQSVAIGKVIPPTQHLYPNGKMTCAFLILLGKLLLNSKWNTSKTSFDKWKCFNLCNRICFLLFF